MTNGEAINWIINISADIGKAEHRDLWHYEQALSEIREMLESAQPELIEQGAYVRASGKELDLSAQPNLQQSCNNLATDTISRQAAIEALAKQMPHSYTPDGSHPADEGIFMAQEIYADCIKTLEILPSAEPEIIRCKDCVCGHCEVWLSGNGSGVAYGYCGRTNFRVLPHDFCSFAQRRTE